MECSLLENYTPSDYKPKSIHIHKILVPILCHTNPFTHTSLFFIVLQNVMFSPLDERKMENVLRL